MGYEWVDMGALHEFLEQQAQKSIPEASTTRQSISNSVRVKIEATPFMAPVQGPCLSVKAEPRAMSMPHASANVKMRALHGAQPM
jgi:hypothetical protein